LFPRQAVRCIVAPCDAITARFKHPEGVAPGIVLVTQADDHAVVRFQIVELRQPGRRIVAVARARAVGQLRQCPAARRIVAERRAVPLKIHQTSNLSDRTVGVGENAAIGRRHRGPIADGIIAVRDGVSVRIDGGGPAIQCVVAKRPAADRIVDLCEVACRIVLQGHARVVRQDPARQPVGCIVLERCTQATGIQNGVLTSGRIKGERRAATERIRLLDDAPCGVTRERVSSTVRVDHGRLAAGRVVDGRSAMSQRVDLGNGSSDLVVDRGRDMPVGVRRRDLPPAGIEALRGAVAQWVDRGHSLPGCVVDGGRPVAQSIDYRDLPSRGVIG